MWENGVRDSDIATSHKRILLPIVASSLLPIERKVDLQYVGDDPRWRSIALIIDDSEDMVLANERRAYLRRASGESFRGLGNFAPDITLARIRPRLATSALLDEIASQMPDSVMLDPATTSFPTHMPERMQETLGLIPVVPSRTPRQVGSIPDGLLRTLRPRSDEEPTS